MPAWFEFNPTVKLIQVKVPDELAIVVGAVVFWVTATVVEKAHPFEGLTTDKEYVPPLPEMIVE